MMKRSNQQDYSVFKPDMEELIDENGEKVLISPIHSRYKELKELEQTRRHEGDSGTTDSN